jgi:hypothetical protein
MSCPFATVPLPRAPLYVPVPPTTDSVPLSVAKAILNAMTIVPLDNRRVSRQVALVGSALADRFSRHTPLLVPTRAPVLYRSSRSV